VAFPNTPLDARVDLKVGGVWQDVTADVYTRDLMEIVRGRPDEGVRTDPGKLRLTFNNGRSRVNPAVSGRYSDVNPMSDLFGLIGRNTAVRVHLPATESHLELNGDPAGFVSTPHTSALNITGDIDIRAELDVDMTDASRLQTIVGKWGATDAERSWVLRYGSTQLGVGQLGFTWRDPVTASVWQGWISVTLVGGSAVRFTLDVDNGAGGLVGRFYQADTINGPWAQIGATITGGFTTSLQATTSDVRIGPSDSTSVPFTGTATRIQIRNGIDGPLVADVDTRPLADNTTTWTDSAGRVWTVNGPARIRQRADRFVGEVSAWPPRWDVSGHNRWVPAEASGVLRRYGRPGASLDSTLRRRIPAAGPTAYWPMEEGSGATQAYSPITGTAPMRVAGLTFAGTDTLPGSSPLPVLGSSASIQATVPSGAATGWHVEFAYRLETLPPTLQQIARVRVAGATMASAVVLAGTSGVRVEIRDNDDSLLGGFTFTDAAALAAFSGRWNRLQIYTSTSGTTTYVHAGWRNIIESAYWVARTLYTGTPGRAVQVTGTWGADLQGMSLGHLAVWSGVSASLTSPYYSSSVTAYESADDGFTGEPAGQRALRLALEENLPLSVRGVIAGQEAMGAQRPLQMLDLLEQCADTDGGIVMEHRARPALRVRGRATLYNQTPALTLRYTARGEIAPPLEPMTDDAETVNDVTVQRIDGSSARAVRDDGPLSVAAVGRYDTSAQLSLARDSQTAPIAGWRLHLGTWDAPRYPVVHVSLNKAPHLIGAVLSVDQGDTIRLTDLPPGLPPGDVDLMVQGYREVLGPYTWDIYFTCTPAEPWSVAALAVWEDFEDDAYEVSIASAGALPWARTNTQSHTGSWCLRSGAITHNQTSDAIINVPPGATELRFWYRTSSENAGGQFQGDRLLVFLDGSQVLRAQGTTPWTQAIMDVTGRSQVTLRYAKDNSAQAGEDAVFVDNITFTGAAPNRVDTDGSRLATAATATATTLLVEVTAGPPWITSTNFPADFPFNAKLGGEVITVLGITGTTSPQTWQVIRAVNGISKPQRAGTAVSLARPAIAPL